MRSALRLFALVALAFQAACATSSTSLTTTTSARRSGVRQSPGLITIVDLTPIADGRDLYSAIGTLRPTFLRPHGGDVSVAIDGMLVGPVSFLRNIPASTVKEVRLLNGPEATFRFGPRHAGAVIAVTTRTR
jgi:hypothetical protein